MQDILKKQIEIIKNLLQLERQKRHAIRKADGKLLKDLSLQSEQGAMKLASLEESLFCKKHKPTMEAKAAHVLEELGGKMKELTELLQREVQANQDFLEASNARIRELLESMKAEDKTQEVRLYAPKQALRNTVNRAPRRENTFLSAEA